MPNMMRAVQIRYGAFTDYFLPANMVIHLLEEIAMDSTDPDTNQLSVSWDRLMYFLNLDDRAALARSREAGLDLRDIPEDAADDVRWDASWGRTASFLQWLQNMRVMMRIGEFEPFIDRHSKVIVFDFS